MGRVWGERMACVGRVRGVRRASGRYKAGMCKRVAGVWQECGRRVVGVRRACGGVAGVWQACMCYIFHKNRILDKNRIKSQKIA